MLEFYSNVKEIFDETFEPRWFYYLLKDENFYYNEEKYKLFKEYKISQAERYLKNAIKKYISDIIKRELYWLKIENKWLEIENDDENNSNWKNKNIEEEISQDLDKELENEDKEDLNNENELIWIDDEINEDEEKNNINKKENDNENLNNLWVKSLLDKVKQYKEKWWLKNIILAKLEKKIYDFRTTFYDDLIKNKKNK
jgi:hypothetical protein